MGAEPLPALAEDEDDDQPEVARLRARLSRTEGGRVRAKTIPPRSAPTRAERRHSELVVYPEDVDRPTKRGVCKQEERPCPFVSCSHHLYLTVNPETGSIRLNFPHLEVWEMTETCVLDVADRGGATLEEVGRALNLTRERIRQIEVSGLSKARLRADKLELEIPPEEPAGTPLGELASG